MKASISTPCILAMIIVSCSSTPAIGGYTYYIDAAQGDDAASGTGEGDAWKSMEILAGKEILPGDSVLFRRGGEYRGQLVPASGLEGYPVTYGAYGSGPLPVIMGSVNKSLHSNWTVGSGNAYVCDETSPYDVGNLVFDHGTSVGVKKWSKAALSAQGEYWYEASTGKLWLYSVGNPADRYSDIECALNRYIVDESDRSYVIFEDLSFMNGAGNGIGGGNTAFITVRDCEFAYIGGGFLYENAAHEMIRYGNGVEFQRNAHDNLVENCLFREIFDTAVTNQSNETSVDQYGIVYRNNVIYNCGMASVEIWVRNASSVLRDIHFENNTCWNAGGGWSQGQGRPSPFGLGHHVISFGSDCRPARIYVRNNIFHTAINPIPADASAILMLFSGGQTVADHNFSFDYNCYYGTGQNLAIFASDGILSRFPEADFASYTTSTSNDAHSFVGVPAFKDEASGDFALTAASPCRDGGLDTGIERDFAGSGRPFGSACDIGAFEYTE